MRSRTALAGALVLLTGAAACHSGGADPAPAPATSESVPSVTVTSASTAAETPTAASSSATTSTPTPAPSTAGRLTESVFRPTIGRWKATPGEGDEGSYEPNGVWVHAIDPAQAIQGLQLQACATSAPLPRPRSVLAADYRDSHDLRAVSQALDFPSPATARQFLSAYTGQVKTCVGRENPMKAVVVHTSPRLVDRRTMLADSSSWVEVVKVTGTVVVLFAANDDAAPLTATELDALAQQV